VPTNHLNPMARITLTRGVMSQCISFLLLLIPSLILHAEDWSYTVRPDDNLWNITEKFLPDQSYRNRLQEYNNIPDGNVIRPGSLLNIPVPWLKVKPASATLIAFSGTVEIQWADGTSTVSPSVGDQLNAADSVATSANSSAIVEFADGSRIFLDPETSVALNTISSFDQNGMIDTSFRLRGGRVESRVIPGGTPETRFRVLTPPAIAAVKGTDFNVAYQPAAKKTLAEVSTGLVGMNAAGVEVEVPAGFGSATIQGQAPGQPVKRLPGVDLSGLQDRVASDTVTFIWSAIAGTVYYAVTLLEAGNGEFITTQKTENPEIQFTSLVVNTYSMHVRTVDDIGLRSDVATHTFEITPRPSVPLLSSPPDNSDQIEPELSFNWESDSSNGEFYFQLSAVNDFASLTIDSKKISETRFQPASPLSPGTYHWRVSLTDNDGNTSEWSETHTFTLHIKPGIPTLSEVSIEKESLVAHWDKQDHAIAYRVEISTDSQFKQIIQHQRTEEPSYLLDNAPIGQMYVRVASVGQVDYVSEYSDFVEIEKKSFWKKYLRPAGIIGLIVFLAFLYRRIR